MIIECFKSLTTPCAAYVRKLGLLDEFISIESRYKRCEKFWKDHLENSKAYIVESIEACPNKESVLVIGSGYHYDLPIKDLTENFKTVALMDLLHPNSVRKRKTDNILLIEEDVTGTLEKLTSNFELLNIVPELKGKYDLVISLNLLSQLALSPLSYIERNLSKIKVNADNSKEEAVAAYGQNLIRNHLTFLKKQAEQGAKVILLSDVWKNVYDKDQNLIASESSLQGLELKDCLEELGIAVQAEISWTWNLAPLGEIDKDYSMSLKVLGQELSLN